MTDETTPKTAEETLQEKLGFHHLTIEELQLALALALKPDLKNILEAMKEYSRQEQRRVAQQVRQQCAEQARIKNQRVNITVAASTTTTAPELQIQSFVPPEVDKESILSVEIEQFLT